MQVSAPQALSHSFFYPEETHPSWVLLAVKLAQSGELDLDGL